MTVTLYRAAEFFRPFPDPAEVFADRVTEHDELLLPLAAIDLAHLDPTLDGTIHFINPVEPDDGCVGEEGDAYFNDLCRINWVGYRYSAGRCTVATDLEYFRLPRLRRALASPLSDPDSPIERAKRKRAASRLEELEQHYREMRRAFEERRAQFAKRGELHARGAEGSFTDETRLPLAELGGHPFAGNWAWLETGIRLERASIQVASEEEDVALPLTNDGRAFRYVGCLDTHNYTDTHDSHLLLFYDPESATALTTFDWS